ncbi:uncharacterized protein LOC126831703 [Patella vulgata]|uniref:uncharacterized protein LOC126831703 n=1 Tax=Patella vulgata TaxID=6465 RepID=UPI0024A977DA|nr:uncharacterized protein LOC126831703 [Patella vulgata]
MKTFYGARYEHHYEGVFTLYENEAWKQEVQIQTKPCRRHARVTCVCGIAIRVGREVYKKEICSDSFFKSGYAQCDGPSLINVKKSGNNQHKIRLPSSTIIKVVTIGNFLNIYMYPSVADKGNVGGLCDQITTSTFIGRDKEVSTYQWSGMPAFSDSWRVNDKLINLFSNDQIHRLEGADGNMFLCKCDETTPTHISCSNSQACSHKEIFAYTLVPVCEKNFIEKRSVGSHYRIPRSSGPASTHISKRQTTNPTWRNGWTEKLATDHCKGLLNKSKTVQICEKSGAAGTQEALNNCVRDIKLIGDDSFAKVAVETVKTSCFHEISYNPIYQRQRTVTLPPGPSTAKPVKNFAWGRSSIRETALPPPTIAIPSFFDEIKQVACPLECSQHGNCNGGVCTCDKGYGSLDCSVSLNTPPTIVYESSANECNSTIGTCNRVHLFGGEFVESVTLVCKIRIEKTVIGTKSLVAERTVSGIYVSDDEVVCPEVVYTRSILPGVSYSYGVSVSNNGVVFSDQIFVPNN